jgi:hypothetical protein
VHVRALVGVQVSSAQLLGISLQRAVSGIAVHLPERHSPPQCEPPNVVLGLQAVPSAALIATQRLPLHCFVQSVPRELPQSLPSLEPAVVTFTHCTVTPPLLAARRVQT